MKKVCILTTFNSYDPSYSLNLVAETQIQMLLAGGYSPVVIANEGFKPEGAYADPRVVIEKCRKATASNQGILPDNWKDEVAELARQYQDVFEKHKVDVVITHDLIAQPAALVNNLAAREVAKKMPAVGWANVVHSVFSSNVASNILEVSKIGREPWPTKSKVIFPNSYDRPRVARNFRVEETDVLHIPHPTDICSFFSFEPELKQIIEEKNVLDKEIVLTFPTRLDAGKQPHVVIEIAAALKRMGSSVSFICLDFASTGGEKVTYRDSMKNLAIDRGLDDTEVIFLSEQHERYRYSGTKKTVMNLFAISNVFVLPSKSETYSLVAQEAGLSGNFMCLNFDFPVMRSVFGDGPKYFKFSSNIDINTGMDGATNTEYSNPAAYYDDIARYIRFMVKYDPVLAMKTKLRMTRSLQAVFRNYFEPMLYSF